MFTLDEIAEAMKCHGAEIREANEWRGLAQHVMGLIELGERALRDEVERLTVERDKWAAQVLCAEVKARVSDDGFEEAVALVHRAADSGNELASERDAAIARAEKAERGLARIKAWSDATIATADEACKTMMLERDDARRMFCAAQAHVNQEVGGICAAARMVALLHWPDAADALFPPEVNP